MAIFRQTVKDQFNVNNSARMAELTGLAYDRAQLELGPIQLNIPRDMFYGLHDYQIPGPTKISRPAGNPAEISSMAAAIASAKNPVILAGGGVG